MAHAPEDGSVYALESQRDVMNRPEELRQASAEGGAVPSPAVTVRHDDAPHCGAMLLLAVHTPGQVRLTAPVSIVSGT